jgi:short-subunit dehydrogenase
MARRTIAGLRVLLTGASSGIGWALALELARHRAKLVLLARSAERLQSLADQVRGLGGEVEIVAGDVTDPVIRAVLIERAVTKFGGLDALINNAGIGAIGRFAEAGPERLRQIFEVNFFAAVELTRSALPHLRPGRTPLVVNIGSILGHRATPRNSEYCASKFALRGFSEALRAELAAEQIDVLLVSPGSTDTSFYEHVIEERGDVGWRRRRGVPADRVARSIVRAMRRGRREIVPSFSGKLLVLANRLCPGLLDRFMSRYG